MIKMKTKLKLRDSLNLALQMPKNTCQIQHNLNQNEMWCWRLTTTPALQNQHSAVGPRALLMHPPAQAEIWRCGWASEWESFLLHHRSVPAERPCGTRYCPCWWVPAFSWWNKGIRLEIKQISYQRRKLKVEESMCWYHPHSIPNQISGLPWS